jgi:hypothetical protein
LKGRAEPALRRALGRRPSEEVRHRAEQLLKKLGEGNRLQVLRGLEVLEHAGTPQARQVLDKLARGASGAWLTQEATAAVERLARRAGEPPG